VLLLQSHYWVYVGQKKGHTYGPAIVKRVFSFCYNLGVTKRYTCWHTTSSKSQVAYVHSCFQQVFLICFWLTLH